LLGTCWGGHYAVQDKDGRPSISGEGEIMLQVPSLMTGYFQRQDLTDEVLINGWYLTGDTGSIDERGVLRMTGRNKYAINRAGIKIYPEELDLLLERHPDVEEACAFGVADPISGEGVAAAVCLGAETNCSEQSLLDWLREQIRPEAVPGRIYLVDNIPKTDRGKLNRANVAEFCLSGGDRNT
jgi:acyl-coenzyme A synthetase/AMP-(fatty) acid ligase